MSNVLKEIVRIDPFSSQNISIGVNYETSKIYFSEGSNGKGDTKVKTFNNKSSTFKDVELNPSFNSGTPFIVSGDLMYYMGSMDATMYVIDMKTNQTTTGPNLKNTSSSIFSTGGEMALYEDSNKKLIAVCDAP